MQAKPTIYAPIPSDRETRRMLITIKQAATQEGCSEDTLKTNAKARRLKAYQDHFGATVMVLPSEVREFLKSRPIIASKHTRKTPSTATATTTIKQPAASETRKGCGELAPEDASISGTPADSDACISLIALKNCQPSEIALVANCLIEVGRQLNDLVSLHSND